MTTALIHCSEAEYFAIPDRFHVSSAGNLLVSPAYYHAHKDDIGDSPSRKLGSITHANMGDPVARAKYAAKPAVDLAGCLDSKGNVSSAPWATTEGKKRIADAEAAFAAKHPGAIVCTEDELYRADSMAASLTKRERELGLTDALHREVCVLWDDAVGTPCILRADAIFVRDGKLLIVDYKTVGKPLTNRNLNKAFFDWSYQRQAAQYDEGVKFAIDAGLLPMLPVEFWIGWVSSLPPFESHFQRVPDEVREVGEAEVIDARARWMEGRRTGRWATASEMGLLVTDVELPRWLAQDSANDMDAGDGLEGL